MTQKMTVIYKAPPGEAKVTEVFGYTFHDGKPEDIEVDDETAERIKTNPMFQPGGPPKADDDHTDHTDHKGGKHK